MMTPGHRQKLTRFSTRFPHRFDALSIALGERAALGARGLGVVTRARANHAKLSTLRARVDPTSAVTGEADVRVD